MNNLSEAKAFAPNFELFEMPSLRIIGLEARCGGELGNTAPALWDNVLQSSAGDTLMALPNWKPDCLLGWLGEWDEETDTFAYMACVFCPPDTQVPDGFSHRDLPAVTVALGRYGEDVEKTLTRVHALGFEDVPCSWKAELYFRKEQANPPKSVKSPGHWLIPVKPMESK